MDTPRMPPVDPADHIRLRSLLDQIDALARQPRTERNRTRGDGLCEEVEALVAARIQSREEGARSGLRSDGRS